MWTRTVPTGGETGTGERILRSQMGGPGGRGIIRLNKGEESRRG